ncbi:histidine kinase [Pseudarthrobacter sp. BRE9]|uniref:sensor histidine kinase n=1 Tax=Pseudarthrobacter sp. BRE9 TaxID=2962582 RepID=UPI002881B0D7|nr:histidine kinase [Pseudarthrobacter sp. BRE9]MDT0169804.1 histidine kinase [Pseudarthrobacter sp. BRE9]
MSKVAHSGPAGMNRSPGFTKADFAVVLLAFAVELASFFPATAGSLSGVLAAAALMYVAGGFVPLLWRHRAPVMVFAGLLLHQAIFVVFLTPGYFTFSELYRVPYMPITTVLVALAAVASDRPLRQSLTALITAVAFPVLITSLGRPFDEDLWFIGTGGFWLGGAWAFGRFVARSRLRISSLEEDRRKAEAAIAQERAHIAAELHDIVSHAVTVMMLHAAGGRRVIDTDPRRAAQALEVIESVGTEATQELARLLSLLKRPGQKSDEDQQSPLPTLSDIHGLIEPVRSAGVQVAVKASGPAGKLDPSVGHAAYRVVQESLTNISKHAGSGTNALIDLRWEPRTLTLNISDDGGGRPENHLDGTSGYGLLGLKERVEVAGGSIEWGPRERGFFLSAHLPSSP